MTSQAVDDKLGKLAYDAYYTQIGDIADPWDAQPRAVQTAWIAAARTIEAHVEAQRDYAAA